MRWPSAHDDHRGDDRRATESQTSSKETHVRTLGEATAALLITCAATLGTTASAQITLVPEPTAVLMFLAGLASIVVMRRSRWQPAGDKA
jgi:hypothetical protein